MQNTDTVITLLSLLSAFIGLLAAIIGRKKVIEIRHVSAADIGSRHRSRSDEATGSRERKWYDKTFWLIFWLILFWPVGIYGLFKSRTVATGWKFGIAALWILFVVAVTSGQ
jgi:hypothetical protein